MRSYTVITNIIGIRIAKAVAEEAWGKALRRGGARHVFLEGVVEDVVGLCYGRALVNKTKFQEGRT